MVSVALRRIRQLSSPGCASASSVLSSCRLAVPPSSTSRRESRGRWPQLIPAIGARRSRRVGQPSWHRLCVQRSAMIQPSPGARATAAGFRSPPVARCQRCPPRLLPSQRLIGRRRNCGPPGPRLRRCRARLPISPCWTPTRSSGAPLRTTRCAGGSRGVDSIALTDMFRVRCAFPSEAKERPTSG